MKKYTPLYLYGLIGLLLLGLMSTFSCKSALPQQTKTIQTSVPTTFILVRHAEKTKDGSKNPNLTKEGQQRAEQLKKMLQNVGLSAIYTTDYNRTRQTVQPIAAALNLPIQTYSPHDTTILDQLKKDKTGAVILMAGHSNTVPAMVNHLIGEEKYQDFEESDYDNLFIVNCSEHQSAKVLRLAF